LAACGRPYLDLFSIHGRLYHLNEAVRLA
jgi:hypothetical protein